MNNRKKMAENIERKIEQLLNQYDMAIESGNLPTAAEYLGKIEILLEQLEENTYHINTQTFLQ